MTNPAEIRERLQQLKTRMVYEMGRMFYSDDWSADTKWLLSTCTSLLEELEYLKDERYVEKSAIITRLQKQVEVAREALEFYNTYSPRQHPEGWYEINIRPDEGGEVPFGTKAYEALVAMDAEVEE